MRQRDDVEVIREAFERWNRRDIDYWIRHSEPEVEVWSKYAALDQGGEPYRGHEGMRAWRAEIDQNFELHEVFADEVRDVGGRVLVLGGVRFRGKASGTEMRYPFGWVCEMRDGALSRMFFYSSHAEALQAVGVHEQMDARTETELIGVLEKFCSGFANRDAEAVMRVFSPDPDLVVVTSEKSLLRGPAEMKRFLDRYIEGATTYSWKWDRRDVSTAGSVAWLLAEGTETAVTGGRLEQHPYRMTMVFERRDDRCWVLVQVHGSSPH